MSEIYESSAASVDTELAKSSASSVLNFDLLLIGVLVLFGLALCYAAFRYLRKVRARYIEKLVYSRSFSEEGVHVGDTVVLTEVVTNDSWFPLFRVDIGFYINSGLEIDGVHIDENNSMFYFTSRFSLMPHTRVTRKHIVKCGQRRDYHLDTAEVFADGDYRYLTAPTRFYVYPAVVDDMRGIYPNTNTIGEFETKSRFITDPFRMSGLRAYQHGDPFNSINFKASARAFRGGVRELMVNNHDSSSQFNMMIYFDFTVPRSSRLLPDETRELAEVGLCYSAAMVEKASAEGGRVGFASNSYTSGRREYIHFLPDGSRAHMLEILKSLATVETVEGNSGSFAALLDRDIDTALFDTDICIITFAVDGELNERIRLLRSRNKSVSILLLTNREASL